LKCLGWSAIKECDHTAQEHAKEMIPEVNAIIAGSHIFVFICINLLFRRGTTEPGHNKNMPFSGLGCCSKNFKHAKSTFVVREFQIHSCAKKRNK